MTSTVALRALDGSRDDMDALQRVLEAAPAYAELLTGAPPGPADAQSTFTMLPDGKGDDDKFVLGVFAGAEMIGCIDVVRGHPDPSTAFVGLLLVAESRQGRGHGSAALAALERFVRAWPGCERLRLGVLGGNRRAHAFWTRHGFVATGETKAYRYGPVSSEIVLYEKALSRLPEVGDDMDETNDDAAWRRRIEVLQDANRAAFLAADRPTLDRLWADDLVVNSPIGRVLNKATVLDLLAHGVLRHVAYEEHVEAMVRHGDTVVVMGGDAVVEVAGGPRIERRFTQVWRATGDDWRLVARHAHGMPRH